MGAINYRTSDYITLGLPLYNSCDVEKNQELMDELRTEAATCGKTIEDAISDYIATCYESDYENIEYELEKHHFNYFHIEICNGYYEGFSLDIENNYPVALDSWEDRREANKEITEIRKFLTKCAGLGMVKCIPSWCTSYSDYPETIKAINVAVKEMRKELKTIPTWRQYEVERREK